MSQTPPSNKYPLLLVVAFMIAIVGINLYSLEQYPLTDCDEIMYADVSYNFITGDGFSTDLVGQLHDLDRNQVLFARLYHVGQGVIIYLLGNTLFAARLFSFLGWGATALLTFLVGKRLFDSTTGVLAGLLAAVSLNALYASHISRSIAWVTAGVMCTFYYYLVVKEHPTRTRYLFLGFVASFGAVGFHLNGAWFILVIGLLVVVENYRTAEGRWWIALFAVGGTVALGIIVLMHFLPYPALTMSQVRSFREVMPWAGTLGVRLRSGLNFLRDAYFESMSHAVSAFTAFALAGIIYALHRREKSDRLLLILFGLSILGFTLGTRHKYNAYFSLWDPLGALFIASAATRISPAIMRRLPAFFSKLSSRQIALLLILPLVSLNLAGWLWLSIKFHPRDWGRYLDEVRALVPPGVRVVGDNKFLYAFAGRNPFVGEVYFSYFRGGDPSLESIVEDLETLQADYVIHDGAVTCDFGSLPIDQRFSDYLEETCTPVGEVTDRWFGAWGQIGQGVPTTVYDCGATFSSR